MELLFIYNEKYYDDGINLSGKFDISYDKVIKRIRIRINDNYINNFWSENNFQVDCFALVGENGAGKTRLMNMIMDTVRAVKQRDLNQNYILILYNEYSGLINWVVSGINGIQLDAPREIYDIIENNSQAMKKFEIAYFHNSLCRNDYLNSNRCNCSLGANIWNYGKMTYSMHYGEKHIDPIVNYFKIQDFLILSFLYGYAINNALEIEFPVPKQFKIVVDDRNYNKKQMLAETNSIGEKAKVILNFIDRITTWGRSEWIRKSIKCLLYDMFDDLCIPKTTPSNKTTDIKLFNEARCIFERENKDWMFLDSFESAKKFIIILDSLYMNSNYISKYKECIKCFEEIQELLRKDDIQNESVDNKMQLIISVNNKTKDTIKNFIETYAKVAFTKPFYEFNFNLSSGEYYFLSLFSQLYALFNQPQGLINVYNFSIDDIEQKSLMLIFDEADITLHPRWQKMFMKWLLDFCEQFFNGKTLKIIVTTHSPIILSDFPAHSVLYLKRDGDTSIAYQDKEQSTFGCNIHSLFLNSFFLEDKGTIGAFAEKKINSIARRINSQKIFNEQDEREILKVISYIGEDVVRKSLMQKVQSGGNGKRIHIKKEEMDVLRETIYRLKVQRDNLDEMIRQLEDSL